MKAFWTLQSRSWIREESVVFLHYLITPQSYVLLPGNWQKLWLLSWKLRRTMGDKVNFQVRDLITYMNKKVTLAFKACLFIVGESRWFKIITVFQSTFSLPRERMYLKWVNSSQQTNRNTARTCKHKGTLSEWTWWVPAVKMFCHNILILQVHPLHSLSLPQNIQILFLIFQHS